MAVQDNNIDVIAINIESGKCILSIIDSLEWKDENEHLLLLQEKINVYLSFIESGEIYDSYPPSKNREFEINIIFKENIPITCEKFLFYTSKIISDAGFALTHLVSQSSAK